MVKTLILGIGNPMKQDDGLGPAVIRRLKARDLSPETHLTDAGTAPENYTGKIKQIKPDKLIMVDAIDFGGKPGEIKVFEKDEFGVRSFSTHNISLKTFVDFLKADLPDLEVSIIGVQPKQAGFGEGLSSEVEKAVDELCMSLV